MQQFYPVGRWAKCPGFGSWYLSVFVVPEAPPLTADGRLDRAALPAPPKPFQEATAEFLMRELDKHTLHLCRNPPKGPGVLALRRKPISEKLDEASTLVVLGLKSAVRANAAEGPLVLCVIGFTGATVVVPDDKNPI